MAGAVQAFIIGEVDESERSVRKTLEKHLLLFSFQDKTFFLVAGFQLSECSSQTCEHESRNAAAGAHTKQLERDCKKEVIMAALWS